MTRWHWLFVLASAMPGPVRAADPPANFERDIQPVIDKYCARCHGDGKKKGNLNLKKYHSATEAAMAPQVWPGVAQRLRAKEMPPEGKPAPTDAERATFAAWADFMAKPAKDSDCRQLANDQNTHFYKGHVMSRRLTRYEFIVSIRELTGVILDGTDLLPSDGAGGEGFDTTGDTLYVSPIHLEKYLDAARTVVDRYTTNSLVTRAVTDRATAKSLLAAFVRRAWRRPVGEVEIERLLTVYDKAVQRGETPKVAVKQPLMATLISPNFLFLVETQPDSDDVHALEQFALASRLSYFLWSAPPDDQLLRLAEAGRLQDDQVLREQTRRMLRDPKARALGENFGIQWLGLTALGTTHKPDAQRFPEFDDGLARALREEAIAFVAAVFRENRSADEFIDCDWSVLNERLARHYGVADVTGNDFRRVILTDRNRGGVVGLGAVHTVTSLALRTSPVLRGKWVLEELLGSKVPPPPPGAGDLPADDRQPDNLTLRQRLEKHRTKADCASCHARMDPLGFSLENFDAIGRWRTEENGQPIDSAGKLPSGENFSSPAELKAVLLKRKGEFHRHLSRKLLGYALGRQLNKYDNCVIDDCMKALDKDGTRVGSLVEEIILSYPFRHRYSKH